MRSISKLRLRLRSLFHRSRAESDLEDELRDYLEREIQREIAAGSSPEEARRTALSSLHGTERLKEECRDARGTRWIEDSLKDLYFALRTLRRAPAFAVTAVAALAFCIGANTAIFSVVDAALFRPLTFSNQDRLVSVTEGIPSTGFPVIPFACSDYLFVMAHNHSFESTGTYRVESYEISGAGEPRRADGARITASLFDVLRVQPAIGRSFTQKEDDGSKAVVVLSYGFAKSLFAEPDRALGRNVHIDRNPYTVIGIMPQSFSFPPRGLGGDSAELLVPVSWSPNDRQEMLNNFDYNMLARLRPNVTVPQATADVRQLLKEITAYYPPEILNLIKGLPKFSLEAHVIPFVEEITGDVRRPLLLLLVAVGIVLLIGCADVANLMFSRMVGRQREFALRAALGAGNGRLTRQTLTEGLVLSALGGTLGLCLALWAVPLLLRVAPDNFPRLNEVGLNWRVTMFVFAITLATPLVFCLAPLVSTLRSSLADQLRNAGRTSTASKHQRLTMSGAVIVQLSLAFILLTTAGLLVRSFVKASEANPGFRPEHVLSLRIALPSAAYHGFAQKKSFFERLLAALSALPGVQQTGAVSDLPMNSTSNRLLSVEGNGPATERVDTIFCTGNALASLRVALLRGRLLQPEDELRNQRPAVISETLARRISPHKDPIGRRVKFGRGEKEPWITIVGVVKDVKSGLTSKSPRSAIFTTPEDWVSEMNVLVRTSGNPLSLASAIRQQVHRLDASLPIGKFGSLDQVLDESLSAERFRTLVLGSFAIAALLLALLGIAGLLAYNTAQRTQELGVRIALGADRRDLLVLVFKQGLQLCGTGIAIGLAASAFVTRAVSTLLYDTSPYDLGTFVAVPSILAFIALGACTLPAWHAVHADPISALKVE